MKKYIILLVCLMSSTIASASENNKKIVVQKDTTIVISDIYPKKSIVGQITKWGKEGNVQSAQLLCGKTKENIYGLINQELSHWLEYNELDGLKINVIYDELKQIGETSFSFEKAAYVNNQWKAMGDWYFIKIQTNDTDVHPSSESESENITSPQKNDTIVASNNSETNKGETTNSGRKQKTKRDEYSFETTENTYSIKDVLLPVLFLIVLGLIIRLFISVNKLRKEVKSFDVNKAKSSLKSEDINIEQIKKAVISKTTADKLVQRISNEDIYNVINRSDIQLYIQTVIAGKVDEYLRNNKITNPVPAGISSGSNQQSSVVQPELRTTKVEYRADNNCFVISENSQNKIFEIYSINGEYYYTIVNDSSIRKEMLGFITAFSGYVETRQASPIPSTVEVIRDGRLIKNGDMYIVDTNCILQVSLM